jgi:hypothetical protein
VDRAAVSFVDHGAAALFTASVVRSRLRLLCGSRLRLLFHRESLSGAAAAESPDTGLRSDLVVSARSHFGLGYVSSGSGSAPPRSSSALAWLRSSALSS